MTSFGGGNPFATAKDRAFLRGATAAVGRAAIAEVRPKIPSRTLRKQLRLVRRSDYEVVLNIEAYWAYWVHEGRGAFSAKQGSLLVWFRNRRNDPRLVNGKSPNRAHELRKLTKEEFRYWSRKNYQAKKAGRVQPMIVAKRVGPVGPNRFFTEGLKPFKTKAGAEFGRRFHAHAVSVIQPLGGVKDEAVFDL